MHSTNQPADPNLIDSRYAAWRLFVVLLIATMGNSGMYVLSVVLPQVQGEFGVSRADASLPYALTMIGFGLSKSYYLSVALLMLSGMFDSVSVIIRSTLIQTLTPENMKGRVAAVNNIFIGSSNELGALESGVAAKLLGVIPSVVAGGHATLLVVAVTAWKAKKLRFLDRIHD